MVVRDYCVEVEPLSEAGAAGWLGRVPDLPGCMSDGDDLVLLEANVAEAIETWISAAHRLGETFLHQHLLWFRAPEAKRATSPKHFTPPERSA